MNKRDENICKNAVRSAIRQSFSRSEHYKEFLQGKRIEWLEGRRKRVSYKCNSCGELFKKTEINVDHIIPIGKETYRSLEDAKYFFDLVYCSHENLQVLCKACHKDKTRQENQNPQFHNALF